MRTSRLTHGLGKTAKIIEIGPSYSPAVPRADGWNSFSLDHASRDELVAKYRGHDVPADRIEEVDFVWRGGPIDQAVPADHHGTFDACVASHVIEHTPDMVAFLRSCTTLLKPAGLLCLAIPDRRYCFDFFKPHTTTADITDAHFRGREVHTKRVAFLNAAYNVFHKGIVWWTDGPLHDLAFPTPDALAAGLSSYQALDETGRSGYEDLHNWAFTPRGFELIIRELAALGLIALDIEIIYPVQGCEFICILRRCASPAPISDAERLTLLREMVEEYGVQAGLLRDTGQRHAPQPLPAPDHPQHLPALGVSYPAYQPSFGYGDHYIDDYHRGLADAEAPTALIDIGIPGWLRLADALKLYELTYFADGDTLIVGGHRGLAPAIAGHALCNARRGRALHVIDDSAAATAEAEGHVLRTGATASFAAGEPHAQIAALMPGGRRFGFAFLDNLAGAAHAASILAACLPVLRAGAFILVHDFNERPGPAPANDVASGVFDAARDRQLQFLGLYGSTGLFRVPPLG